MPLLDHSVTGPAAGAVVGRSITVSGVARVVEADSGKLLVINISGVQVEFEAGGPVLDAQLANGAWSCTGSLLPSVPGGTQVTLTAVLRGTRQFDISHIHGEPDPGPKVPFESGQSVSVQVAVASPPTFTVTAPADGAVDEAGGGMAAGRPADGDSEPGWRPGVAWLRPGLSRAAGWRVLAGPAQLDALHQHPGPGDQVERAEQQREGDRADACRISS